MQCMILKKAQKMISKLYFSKKAYHMRYAFISALLALFFFSGCAPKEVNLASINPTINPIKEQRIATYDPDSDCISFYIFSEKDGKVYERTWGKMLPFRIDFMDLWSTGLGLDIKRITNGNADEPKSALMQNASLNGMKPLHNGQKDYIIDYEFARDVQTVLDDYEERMRRYEMRRFPFSRIY